MKGLMPVMNDDAPVSILAKGPLIRTCLLSMGEVLANAYLAVRRSEWEAYSAGDAEFEHQGHFEKY